jgi:hypothetical protein
MYDDLLQTGLLKQYGKAANFVTIDEPHSRLHRKRDETLVRRHTKRTPNLDTSCGKQLIYHDQV